MIKGNFMRIEYHGCVSKQYFYNLAKNVRINLFL